MTNLNLGVIGNCVYSALIDPQGTIVWCCLPRFDSDPVFHALLGKGHADSGYWSIEMDDLTRSEQVYQPNTAILVTRLYDAAGNALEIRDFAPRFFNRGRTFRPVTMVRRMRPLQGMPRVRIRLQPGQDQGASRPPTTHGSNHIRYAGSNLVLRLTTNAPIPYVLSSTPFLLEESLDFILGPDETVQENISRTARDFEERTAGYWKEWTRNLELPLEWQDAVIRAAITLKLCTFEPTGAIIAAMTTSIPEAPDSKRNWDYRFCWLRDAFFVVRALNSVAKVTTMENYLRYIANIVSSAEDGFLQPVFGIGLEARLVEREVESLAGYRGMGPVRFGNQAHEHNQHDVYGNVVLAASQAFFDQRLLQPATDDDFRRLEVVGEKAFEVHAEPDASMWELRHRARVHTSSVLMCWAACDRLAKIAGKLAKGERATYWSQRAQVIRKRIETDAWNAELNSYVESFGGTEVEAGLLLMAEIGFHPAEDPRFLGTVAEIERRLRRDNHLFRYAAADDFGEPENAFNICTFWYIDALIRIGRRQEAREIFEEMLTCRNHVGLLSEDVNTQTHELWGNFPQTYSLVGIINAAMRLSESWESQV